MAYTATVWVATTAPGISATNLNNLETQYTEATSYFNDQISTSTPLSPTSAGTVGTSTHWAAADHQHPYAIQTDLANSVTGSLLAYSMSGNYAGAGGFPMMGAVVKRSGVYLVHMMRDGAGGAGTAGTLTLYGNNASVGGVNLVTTSEYTIGDVALTAGDVLYTLFSDSATGGTYYTLFYNADGWW